MTLDGDHVSLTGEDIMAIMHSAFMVLLEALDEANVLPLSDAALALETTNPTTQQSDGFLMKLGGRCANLN